MPQRTPCQSHDERLLDAAKHHRHQIVELVCNARDQRGKVIRAPHLARGHLTAQADISLAREEIRQLAVLTEDRTEEQCIAETRPVTLVVVKFFGNLPRLGYCSADPENRLTIYIGTFQKTAVSSDCRFYLVTRQLGKCTVDIDDRLVRQVGIDDRRGHACLAHRRLEHPLIGKALAGCREISLTCADWADVSHGPVCRVEWAAVVQASIDSGCNSNRSSCPHALNGDVTGGSAP